MDRKQDSRRWWFATTLLIALLTASGAVAEAQSGAAQAAPSLDPSARLLRGSDASEVWSLYIELESGHRIAQQFLLSNAGPGRHNAVALGHLIEEGREPYQYSNGRRRARWTLSEDGLFFDIAASHLDLHRPTGELRITKDDIEIRLFFDFAATDPAWRVPENSLPEDYHTELLAVAAKTHGTIQAPWMSEPIETRGRTWLVHTWTPRSEGELLDRRVDYYRFDDGTAYYGLELSRGDEFRRTWLLSMIDSEINVEMANLGPITLDREWLRFDPLSILPRLLRWLVGSRSNRPQVWADATIGVRLCTALDGPCPPDASETANDSSEKQETEEATAERSLTGVASITSFHRSDRR
ncbi:MAG: hypothetical protein VCB25_08965 [Myxococcota bacterium]